MSAPDREPLGATKDPRSCVFCGKPAVQHWVRPGVGSMYCERSPSEDKYDRGTLTPDEQAESARIEAALRTVVGILAVEGADS